MNILRIYWILYLSTVYSVRKSQVSKADQNNQCLQKIYADFTWKPSRAYNDILWIPKKAFKTILFQNVKHAESQDYLTHIANNIDISETNNIVLFCSNQSQGKRIDCINELSQEYGIKHNIVADGTNDGDTLAAVKYALFNKMLSEFPTTPYYLEGFPRRYFRHMYMSLRVFKSCQFPKNFCNKPSDQNPSVIPTNRELQGLPTNAEGSETRIKKKRKLDSSPTKSLTPSTSRESTGNYFSTGYPVVDDQSFGGYTVEDNRSFHELLDDFIHNELNK